MERFSRGWNQYYQVLCSEGKDISLPLDLQNGDDVGKISQQGEATIQHVESMFPLWYQQKELLKLLNEER